ncbi:uncharacterized protein BJX67DRAFT_353190 [Aspergillus lucknowensis]|uniref:Uncharacterized protein n=1 Tax=Aspergillus lucknowensis TaxID=176173 RepID=A0ABR4LRR8_9EURO
MFPTVHLKPCGRVSRVCILVVIAGPDSSAIKSSARKFPVPLNDRNATSIISTLKLSTYIEFTAIQSRVRLKDSADHE